MTSPDLIVPAKALRPTTVFTLQDVDAGQQGAESNLWLTQVLEGFRVNLVNGLLGGFTTVAHAVGAGLDTVISAILGGPGNLQALSDWAADKPGLSELAEAVTGIENGNMNDITSWVNLLLGRDTALSGRVSRIEGKIAEGADYFDDFNRGEASNLGPEWNQGGTGEALGIYDQAAQLHRSLFPSIGRRWALAKQVTTGNAFTQSVVIHPAGTSPFVAMRVIARANVTCTEGLSVNLFGGKCYLSRFTRTPGTNGGADTWTDNDLDQNLTQSYSNTATVEFSGDDADHLWVKIDGLTVLQNLPGTGNVGPMDADHRSGGFSLGTVIGLPAQYSGAPASFALRSTAELEAVPVATITARAAQATATAVQSQVAAIIAKDQAEESQGFNGHETFDRADAPNLGPDWDQLQTGAGYGSFGIIGNTAAYYTASGQGGNAGNVAIGPGAFATDSQSMIIVVGSAGNGSSLGRWWVRCNGVKANMSGVFVEKGEGFYRLCACVSGTITELDRKNIAAQDGDQLEIRAGDSGAVIVKRSGVSILSGTDAGQVPKGAGFRRYAMSVVVNDAYFNQYRPPSTNSIDVSDFAPPAVRGTTWRAARFGTAATSNMASGDQRFPAGTFGTVYCSPSVTLDSAGSAIVPVEGMYLIKFRVKGNATNNGYIWRPILWVMAAGSSTWVIDQYGVNIVDANSNENQDSCGDTFPVYLRAGDKVAIGMRQAGTLAIVGSAAGIDTLWTGTLLANAS